MKTGSVGIGLGREGGGGVALTETVALETIGGVSVLLMLAVLEIMVSAGVSPSTVTLIVTESALSASRLPRLQVTEFVTESKLPPLEALTNVVLGGTISLITKLVAVSEPVFS